MKNYRNLEAELRRHNLLIPLFRSQIIAEAVGKEQLSSEDLETARHHFLIANGIKDENSLENFRIKQGWCDQDLNWQLTLPFRIKKHCLKHFRHKAEAYFLKRKYHLDRVVYSLIRTKDSFLANELYFRINDGESNFGDLAAQFSEGPERKTRGIIGPVPSTQAHPYIAELLRADKAGVLYHPFSLDEWWIVMRLESYTPACFDDDMAERLSHDLFKQWVEEELSLRMSESGVLTTA